MRGETGRALNDGRCGTAGRAICGRAICGAGRAMAGGAEGRGGGADRAAGALPPPFFGGTANEVALVAASAETLRTIAAMRTPEPTIDRLPRSPAAVNARALFWFLYLEIWNAIVLNFHATCSSGVHPALLRWRFACGVMAHAGSRRR